MQNVECFSWRIPLQEKPCPRCMNNCNHNPPNIADVPKISLLKNVSDWTFEIYLSEQSYNCGQSRLAGVPSHTFLWQELDLKSRRTLSVLVHASICSWFCLAGVFCWMQAVTSKCHTPPPPNNYKFVSKHLLPKKRGVFKWTKNGKESLYLCRGSH